MDTKTLSQFIAWSRTTDLQEIVYKKPGEGIEISAAGAVPAATDFSSKLKPVASPGVGIYHAGRRGKEVTVKENTAVKVGDLLGVIVVNKTEKDVLAPVDGIIKIAGVADGQPVEYGQPLFFLEPK